MGHLLVVNCYLTRASPPLLTRLLLLILTRNPRGSAGRGFAGCSDQRLMIGLLTPGAYTIHSIASFIDYAFYDEDVMRDITPQRNGDGLSAAL